MQSETQANKHTNAPKNNLPSRGNKSLNRERTDLEELKIIHKWNIWMINGLIIEVLTVHYGVILNHETLSHLRRHQLVLSHNRNNGETNLTLT